MTNPGGTKRAYFASLDSSIYLLECRDSAGSLYAKIGKANDPFERISVLICGLPMPVSRVRYVPIRGASKALLVEKELHKYLARWHSRGEWFLFPSGDPAALDAYGHGVGAILSGLLCRGAWEYIDIDWSAYEALKADKKANYLRAKAKKPSADLIFPAPRSASGRGLPLRRAGIYSSPSLSASSDQPKGSGTRCRPRPC